MARVRSPNFPAISLGEAIQRVRQIWDKEQQIAAPREVVAKHLGYNGLNGASLKVISALGKYGLLISAGDSHLMVSEVAMRILFPEGDGDKEAAIEEAAFRPALFQQFREEWGDRCPSPETFRSYLLRRNFAVSAVETVIGSYQATLDLVTHVQTQNSSRPISRAKGTLTAENEKSVDMQASASDMGMTAFPFSINIVPTGLKISADVRDKQTLTRMIELLRAYEPFLNNETGNSERVTEKTDEDAQGQ